MLARSATRGGRRRARVSESTWQPAGENVFLHVGINAAPFTAWSASLTVLWLKL